MKKQPMAGALGLGVLAVMLGLSVLLAYTVSPGDAPNDIAQRFDASGQEIRQTNAVEADDSAAIYYDVVDPTKKTPPDTPTPWMQDIYEVDHRSPVDAPLRSSPEARDRVTYANVVDQFAVEENPRYRHSEKKMTLFVSDARPADVSAVTYCNTFVWDVTRAMGAEIPYWVDENGEPNGLVHTEQGWMVWDPADWMSANGMNQWLNQKGPESDWREVSAEKAQELANQGYPTVASVYEPQGFGHIGIVRPGSLSNGPALAQAGTTNVNYAHVYDIFPREDTQFFVHP